MPIISQYIELEWFAKMIDWHEKTGKIYINFAQQYRHNR